MEHSLMLCSVLDMPYEDLNLANKDSRKLGVFGRKLEGSHFLFHCILRKIRIIVQTMIL